MTFIRNFWTQIRRVLSVSSRWAVIGILPPFRLIISVTVKTSLTRERYKLGTATKELEKKGKCDLYRGLAMAQVCVCRKGDM